MQRLSRPCSRRIATRPRVRAALLALLSLTIATSALAQELRWEELQRQGRIAAGTLLPPDALKVEGTGQGAAITVLTIDRPTINGPRYALTGQVRYDAVEGTGYLELWNYFPDGGQYFSRTLAESGPMMKLQGTSGWRAFTLPFDGTGAAPPTRLVLNVVLPSGGVVYLGPLQLSALGDQGLSAGAFASGQASTPNLLGGIVGGLVGSVGALIGVLTAMGRARRVVSIAAATLIVGGTLAFLAGIVAVARSQPSAVSYPLLLLGFVATVVPLSSMSAIRRRYQEIELRTMRARDLG